MSTAIQGENTTRGMVRLLQFDLERIEHERLRNVERFLAARELGWNSLMQAFDVNAGDFRHLLITSSPVHGLGNSTSDIDLIGIAASCAVTGTRMAAQKFVGTTHYELSQFGVAEIADSFQRLTDSSSLEMEKVGAVLGNWNTSCVVPMKYVERVVSGVDLGARCMPFKEYLQPLALCFINVTLLRYYKASILAVLAERGGEQRGRIGYAVNALLDLMNAVLCCHGTILLNRKWHLQGFTNLVESGELQKPLLPLVAPIQKAFDQAMRGLRDASVPLATEIWELLLYTCDLFDCCFQGAEISWRDRPDILPFLKGGACYLFGQDAVIARDVLKKDSCFQVREIWAMEQPVCGAVLSQLRAGHLEINITPKSSHAGN